jgi:hypothetical protein
LGRLRFGPVKASFDPEQFGLNKNSQNLEYHQETVFANMRKMPNKNEEAG